MREKKQRVLKRDGRAYDTCSRCEYTTYEAIPALGHDLVHHDAKAPTITEIGWEAYDTCSRCDYTTYRELPKLTNENKKNDTKENQTETGKNTAEKTGAVNTVKTNGSGTVKVNDSNTLKAPQTGDTGKLFLWILISVVSVSAAASTLKIGLKRREQRDVIHTPLFYCLTLVS